MKSIRCILGLHKWKYYNKKYNRECLLCHGKQKILGGNGGGECWCWWWI